MEVALVICLLIGVLPSQTSSIAAGNVITHRSDDATSLWPAQLQMNEDNDERPTKKQKLEDMEADLKTENKIYEPLPSDKSCPVNTQKCEIPHSEKGDEVCVIKKEESTPEIHPHSVYSPQQINTNNLEVHTLPVGQGDCTVIYCPGGKKAVLFDCGSIAGGDNRFSEKHVRSYFNKVSEITIIVSHGDKDHYNYLPTVFNHTEQEETFNKITQMIIGGPEADLSAFREIVDWRRELRSKIIQTGPGHASVADLNEMSDFCGSSDVKFEFIAAGRAGKKNERSIVMKLSRKGGPSSLLFSGDMEDGVAETLATDPATKAKLRSTHYKIAHHGASSLANKLNWLKAINPEEAHVSQAYYGPFGHPRCDAIDLLLKNITLGTTSTVGRATHPFTCFRAKPKKKQQSGKLEYEQEDIRTRGICHRLYSTAPTAYTICTIVLIFEPGKPAKTRYSCGKVDGSKIKDIICDKSGPDDDDDDVTGEG